MNKPNPYDSPQVDTPVERPKAIGFAACPNCSQQNANRARWTIWVGLVGPSILNPVKCVHCGTTFNSKTGESSNTAIAIYFCITVFIGIAVMIAIFMTTQ
jgi:uncharacterized Zn-finger protein